MFRFLFWILFAMILSCLKTYYKYGSLLIHLLNATCYFLAVSCIAKIFDILMMMRRGSLSSFYLTALSVRGISLHEKTVSNLIELFFERHRYQYLLNIIFQF